MPAAAVAGAVVVVVGYFTLLAHVVDFCAKRFAWSEESASQLFMLAFVLPWLLCTIILSLFKRPPIPSGHCRRCGYELTGNLSGTCPECGFSFVLC